MRVALAFNGLKSIDLFLKKLALACNLKALTNRANMLAKICTNIIGQYIGQRVGAVCYRHQHVGKKKKTSKMLANIY